MRAVVSCQVVCKGRLDRRIIVSPHPCSREPSWCPNSCLRVRTFVRASLTLAALVFLHFSVECLVHTQTHPKCLETHVVASKISVRAQTSGLQTCKAHQAQGLSRWYARRDRYVAVPWPSNGCKAFVTLRMRKLCGQGSESGANRCGAAHRPRKSRREDGTSSRCGGMFGECPAVVMRSRSMAKNVESVLIPYVLCGQTRGPAVVCRVCRHVANPLVGSGSIGYDDQTPR